MYCVHSTSITKTLCKEKFHLPVHSTMMLTGSPSQTGKTSAPRNLTAVFHSLTQTSSLMYRQSSLRAVCKVLLESHKLNMEIQRKGIMASWHCWLGLRKIRPLTNFFHQFSDQYLKGCSKQEVEMSHQTNMFAMTKAHFCRYLLNKQSLVHR